MRRFRFPLAKVRRWRAHRERAARRELAGALSELARLERRLATVSSSIAACQEGEGGPAQALAVALGDGLRRTEASLRVRLGEADHAVVNARAMYAGRRKDLQVLARLEDQRRAQWRAGVLAEEQTEIEELGRLLAPVDRFEEERR